MLSAIAFLEELNSCLSSTVQNDRTIIAKFDPPWSGTKSGGIIFVNYFNLPEARHRQRRGGGAESENNRMLFSISGWGKTEDVPVEKVSVEQTVGSIVPWEHPLRSMRKKTGSPDKVAVYLANYINQIAEMFPPNLTHE